MENLQPITFPGIDPEKPLIIAGPCSAETREQVMTTARELASTGLRIFRAGIWKPRTKPGGFEGVGSIGLQWLADVKSETGMFTATEVANKAHTEEALAAGVDIIWIGARTSANPFAMQEIADTLEASGRAAELTVLVKNPVNPDLELWVGALQRIYNAGVRRLGAIHRGFSTYGKHLYRNVPQWHIPVELRLRYPNLPIIVDPSHIGGKRELIAPLSQQAMDMGFNGLIVESHCNPDCALSDAAQQVTPEILNFILNTLVIRNSRQSTESLTLLRQQIDRIDNELLEVLAKRMSVSRDIGRYKKEHRMPVVQAGRYNDVIRTRAKLGEEMGMSREFMKTILLAIHDESVRQQIEIINDRAK
ncbi:MAG: bifunctional 3-deoxy-7-phosphoheptulonate synthase/chorismate mutase type II [Bacteroides sp.]|nr:bifunctional 3-deoxy-7-phosphoheptulonate synthase/chorismate mutase type II [Bacteroides sp.]